MFKLKRGMAVLMSFCLTLTTTQLEVISAADRNTTTSIPIVLKTSDASDDANRSSQENTYTPSKSNKIELGNVTIGEDGKSKGYETRAYEGAFLDQKQIDYLAWHNQDKSEVSYRLNEGGTIPEGIDIYYKIGEKTPEFQYSSLDGKATINFEVSDNTIQIKDATGKNIGNQKLIGMDQAQTTYQFLVSSSDRQKRLKVKLNGQEITASSNFSTTEETVLQYTVSLEKNKTYTVNVTSESGQSAHFQIDEKTINDAANKKVSELSRFTWVAPIASYTAYNSTKQYEETVKTSQKYSSFFQNTTTGTPAGGTMEADILVNVSGFQNDASKVEVMNFLLDSFKISGESIQLPAISLKAFGNEQWDWTNNLTKAKIQEHYDWLNNYFLPTQPVAKTKFTSGPLAGATVTISVQAIKAYEVERGKNPSMATGVGNCRALVYHLKVENAPGYDLKVDYQLVPMSQGYITLSQDDGIEKTHIYSAGQWTGWGNGTPLSWIPWSNGSSVLAKSIEKNTQSTYTTAEGWRVDQRQENSTSPIQWGTSTNQKFDSYFYVKDGYINPKVTYYHFEMKGDGTPNATNKEAKIQKNTDGKYTIESLPVPQYGLQALTIGKGDNTPNPSYIVNKGNISSLNIQTELHQVPISIDLNGGTGVVDTAGSLNVKTQKYFIIPEEIPTKDNAVFGYYELFKTDAQGAKVSTGKKYYPGQIVSLDDIGPTAQNGEIKIKSFELKAVFDSDADAGDYQTTVQVVLETPQGDTVYQTVMVPGLKGTYVSIDSDSPLVADTLNYDGVVYKINPVSKQDAIDGQAIQEKDVSITIRYTAEKTDTPTLEDPIVDGSNKITVSNVTETSEITVYVNNKEAKFTKTWDSVNQKFELTLESNLNIGDKVTVKAKETGKYESDPSDEVTVVEDKFDENNVVGLKIINAPNKVRYEEGELFDSTGMVVRLTDERGKTLDVEAKDFAKYGIVIEPTDKTALTQIGDKQDITATKTVKGTPYSDNRQVLNVTKKVIALSQYSLEVTKDGAAIPDHTIKAGTPIDITISVKDEKGNIIDVNKIPNSVPETLQVKVPGVESEVTLKKQQDGTYKATVVPTKVADGYVSVITPDYTGIEKKPLKVIANDTIKATLTMVPNELYVGKETTGTLVLTDSYDNPITKATPQIKIGDVEFTGKIVEDEKELGKYHFTYVTDKIGIIPIKALIQDEEVAQAKVTVLDLLDSETPVIQGPVKDTDRSVNVTAAPGSTIQLQINGKDITGIKVEEKEDGTFTIHLPDDIELKENDKLVVIATEKDKKPAKSQEETVVLSDVNRYHPIGKNLIVNVNDSVNAKTGIENTEELPGNTTYSFKEAIDTSIPGRTIKATIQVKYPDGTAKDVDIEITVRNRADSFKNEYPDAKGTVIVRKDHDIPWEQIEITPNIKVVTVSNGAISAEVVTVSNAAISVENVSGAAIVGIKNFNKDSDTIDTSVVTPPDSPIKGWVYLKFDDNSIAELPLYVTVIDKELSAKPIIFPVKDTDTSFTVSVKDENGAKVSGNLNIYLDGKKVPQENITDHGDGTYTVLVPEGGNLDGVDQVKAVFEENGKYPNTTQETVEKTITDAMRYHPIGKDIMVEVGHDVSAVNGIQNTDKLPEGTIYQFKEPVDTHVLGERDVVILVQYPDGSSEEVTVKLTVFAQDSIKPEQVKQEGNKVTAKVPAGTTGEVVLIDKNTGKELLDPDTGEVIKGTIDADGNIVISIDKVKDGTEVQVKLTEPNKNPAVSDESVVIKKEVENTWTGNSGNSGNSGNESSSQEKPVDGKDENSDLDSKEESDTSKDSDLDSKEEPELQEGNRNNSKDENKTDEQGKDKDKEDNSTILLGWNEVKPGMDIPKTDKQEKDTEDNSRLVLGWNEVKTEMDIPKTGDKMNYGRLINLEIVSLLGALLIIVKRKREE